MYTPRFLKDRYGEDFEYEPEDYLKARYNLLIKYNKLVDLDLMVFEGKVELTRYLQSFSDITEDDRVTEFYAGTELGLLDILNGDLSEIAPIIYDRVKLFKIFYKGTLREIFERFVSNPKTLTSLYSHYFDEEV